MKRLTHVVRIDGVDVYFHWSTLLIGVMLLVYGFQYFLDALALLAGYCGLLLVHEWGHVVAARSRRCAAYSIEVYPIHGLTRISAPASRFDEGVIAWGGVLAQVAVAAPVVAWVAAFGFGTSGPGNAFAVLLGPFGLFIAAVNLMPLARLDGAKAWPLIPMLVGRVFGRIVAGRERRSPRARRSRRKDWIH
jgi:hypothetical protein